MQMLNGCLAVTELVSCRNLYIRVFTGVLYSCIGILYISVLAFDGRLRVCVLQVDVCIHVSVSTV